MNDRPRKRQQNSISDVLRTKYTMHLPEEEACTEHTIFYDEFCAVANALILHVQRNMQSDPFLPMYFAHSSMKPKTAKTAQKQSCMPQIGHTIAHDTAKQASLHQ